MINRILLLCMVALGTVVHAQQLKNCSACATVRYQASNLIDNELWELQLLRNEIFARHQYRFNNQRLLEYYEQFDWYQPSTNTVDLNATEQHNVQLFKTCEAAIKEDRQRLIQALTAFKKALQEDNRPQIEAIFKRELAEDDKLYATLVATLKDILTVVDLDAIYWHKGRALYEVKIDNGYSVTTKRLSISGNTIYLMCVNPESHSSLMEDDAFEYPSNYYSEYEYNSGVLLEWANGKLKVTQLILVG